MASSIFFFTNTALKKQQWPEYCSRKKKATKGQIHWTSTSGGLISPEHISSQKQFHIDEAVSNYKPMIYCCILLSEPA